MPDLFDDPFYDPFADPDYPRDYDSHLGDEVEAGLLGVGVGIGGTMLVEWLLEDHRHKRDPRYQVPPLAPGRNIHHLGAGELGFQIAGLGPDQLLQQSQRVGNDIPWAQIPPAVSAAIPPNFTLQRAYWVTVPSQPGAQAFIAEGILVARKATLNLSPWAVNLPNVGTIAAGGNVTGYAGI